MNTNETPEVDGPADAGDPGAAASTPGRTPPRPPAPPGGSAGAGDARPTFTTETGADKTSTEGDPGQPV